MDNNGFQYNDALAAAAGERSAAEASAQFNKVVDGHVIAKLAGQGMLAGLTNSATLTDKNPEQGQLASNSVPDVAPEGPTRTV